MIGAKFNFIGRNLVWDEEMIKWLKRYLITDRKDPETPRTIFGAKSPAISKGDLLFLEYVLSLNQDFKILVEFGTFSGITSVYLGTAALMRDGEFYTYDNSIHHPRPIAKKVWRKGFNAVTIDLLDHAQKEVIKVISKPNVFLDIDNGNKGLEAELYGNHLRVGSGFVIHDWYSLTDKWRGRLLRQPWLSDFNMEYEWQAAVLLSKFRFFRRVRDEFKSS